MKCESALKGNSALELHSSFVYQEQRLMFGHQERD